MSLLQHLGLGRRDASAHQLYNKVVSQARTTGFYTGNHVPDTPGGRFDMIALHAYVVMRRLREIGGSEANELSQALFDMLFADVDQNLREMGVGDLGVGRQVKGLAKSYYGRVKAYDDALAEGNGALQRALRRNLYADGAAGDAEVNRMALYLQSAITCSRQWEFASLRAAHIDFPPAPAA